MDEAANLRDLSDAELESLVFSEEAKPGEKGAAKAELVRRQRKHELELEQKKREHDVALFNAQSDLTRLSHEFEERLAQEQQAHAEALAAQPSPARNAAMATIWAAAAATLSAIAAIVSAGVAYRTYAGRPDTAIAAEAPSPPKLQAVGERGNRGAMQWATPFVQFYTETRSKAPIVGIQIQNEGVMPLTVSRIEYFVDGMPMRGADEATNRGQFLGPDRIQALDFAPGDQMAVGEKDWLYFRATRSKTELQKFADFVSNHVAIGVTLCSEKGRCVSRCSVLGRCGPGYGG